MLSSLSHFALLALLALPACNAATLKFYFNLVAETNCNVLGLSGKTLTVSSGVCTDVSNVVLPGTDKNWNAMNLSGSGCTCMLKPLFQLIACCTHKVSKVTTYTTTDCSDTGVENVSCAIQTFPNNIPNIKGAKAVCS